MVPRRDRGPRLGEREGALSKLLFPCRLRSLLPPPPRSTRHHFRGRHGEGPRRDASPAFLPRPREGRASPRDGSAAKFHIFNHGNEPKPGQPRLSMKPKTPAEGVIQPGARLRAGASPPPGLQTTGNGHRPHAPHPSKTNKLLSSFLLFNFRALGAPAEPGCISLLTGYSEIANQDYSVRSTLISIKRPTELS